MQMEVTAVIRPWNNAFALGLASMAFLAAGSNARADYSITISETGGPTITIDDGGSLDEDGVVNGVINAITNASLGGLNAIFSNFQFTSLGGVSNALTGSGNDDAVLTQTGQVTRVVGGTGTLTIESAESSFQFPIANPKTMGTAGATTFTNFTGADSRTFQSLFNNSIPSGLLTFVPSGVNPSSPSQPTDITPLGNQVVPFALSNTSVLNIGPGTSSTARSNVQFTGSTVVTAVPEPASFALILLGLPLAIGYRLRRSA